MTEFRYDLNVELLDTMIDWAQRSNMNKRAEDEPEWEQGIWYERDNHELKDETGCGTVCCVAGYIAEVKQVVSLNRFSDYVPKLELLRSTENHLGISWDDWAYCQGMFLGDAEMYGVAFVDMGAYFLGITRSEADRLFSGGNTLEDLIFIANELKEEYAS
jgi:hypothetical protein